MYLGVLWMARFIYFIALTINSAKKSGRRFRSEVFSTGNEAKLDQGVSKDGKYHNLGDSPCIPVHQHKSWFANLQTLFLSTIQVLLSLEHLVFCFCFWSSISNFCRPPLVVRLL
jgi:hypothetical protein